jgi:hypothetical protein
MADVVDVRGLSGKFPNFSIKLYFIYLGVSHVLFEVVHSSSVCLFGFSSSSSSSPLLEALLE